MTEHKPAPDPAVSLKYIAWDIKQLSANVKILTDCIKEFLEAKQQSKSRSERDPF